jgi:hypothetical protein
VNPLYEEADVKLEIERITHELHLQAYKMNVWAMFFTPVRAYRRAAFLALAIASSATMSGSYVSDNI